MDTFEYKVTFVGDSGVGKTSLLSSYISNYFPEYYVPRVMDVSTTSLFIKQKEVKLSLWDQAGGDDYEMIRLLAYPGTNVFVIVFDLHNKQSLENVTEHWYKEITNKLPHYYSTNDVPLKILLVGNKTDNLEEGNNKISLFDILDKKKEIKAFNYLKCSARKDIQKEGFMKELTSVSNQKDEAVEEEEAVDEEEEEEFIDEDENEGEPEDFCFKIKWTTDGNYKNSMKRTLNLTTGSVGALNREIISLFCDQLTNDTEILQLFSNNKNCKDNSNKGMEFFEILQKLIQKRKAIPEISIKYVDDKDPFNLKELISFSQLQQLKDKQSVELEVDFKWIEAKQQQQEED
ncbi:hypothetical protein ABK040_010936 [Willaertia magna]